MHTQIVDRSSPKRTFCQRLNISEDILQILVMQFAEFAVCFTDPDKIPAGPRAPTRAVLWGREERKVTKFDEICSKESKLYEVIWL